MQFDCFSDIGIHEELKLWAWIELRKGTEAFPICALIDTGSTCTMLPRNFAEFIGINFESGKERRINGISGGLLGRVHRVETALFDDNMQEIAVHPIDITFVEHSDLALIGMNLITKFDWKLLFSSQCLKVTSH